MNIGLTQRIDDRPERGEQWDALNGAWAAMLLQAGLVPVPLPNCPGQAARLIDATGIAGVILTGGSDIGGLPGARDVQPRRDAFEGELLELCMARRLPTLGVCRGMQMIIHLLGGRLEVTTGHVACTHDLRVEAACGAAHPGAMPLEGRARVNSFHRFAARPEWIPHDLAVCALAGDGGVEAVVHRALPLWGVAWHPERPVAAGGTWPEPREMQLLAALFEGRR